MKVQGDITLMGFQFLDGIVLFLYLGIVVWIGWKVARKNKSFQQFVFGSKSIPWWAVGISLIATSLSSTSFLGPPETAYRGNMSILMYQVGALLAIVLVVTFFIPAILRTKVTSAYEILEKRFDGKTRVLAASIYCLHVLLRTGVLLYGPALVLAEILQVPVSMAIVLIGIVAIIYTYIGGLEAVIWTDVLQFAVFFGGGFLVVYYCTSHGNSLAELWSYGVSHSKTDIWNFEWDISKANNFWTLGLFVLVLELSVRTTDQQFVQRYLSCKSVAEAKNSAALSWILGLVFAIFFLSIGVLLYSFFAKNPNILPSNIAPNRVFPFFMVHVLPSGITGILVAAIFSAAMSSLDSALTALSNTFTVDFIGRRKKAQNATDLSEKEKLFWARISVLVWGLLGIGMGLIVAETDTDLLTTALKFSSLFIGPLLGLFILALFYKGALAGTGVFLGTLCGVGSLFFFNPSLLASLGTIFGQSWSMRPIVAVSWPVYPAISAGTTLLVGFVLGKVFCRTTKRVEAK
jgi:SSS family solute:Na+ symporter